MRKCIKIKKKKKKGEKPCCITMGCPAQLRTVLLCASADQQSADMRCPESGLNSIILAKF